MNIEIVFKNDKPSQIYKRIEKLSAEEREHSFILLIDAFHADGSSHLDEIDLREVKSIQFS